ncbi:MAG: bifunctional fucokinase/L-fucose-1-P-guanylyltransferase [Lachnospiraceae bacterium]|nr:bifunctional fucokinase/L-fucose-1-P-guanylyltransferase [Lachnospiraceae bacterium]
MKYNDMINHSTIFLTQSYIDIWDDYIRSLTRDSFPCWDYIILTASNEQQAEAFNAQLEERRLAEMLPFRTKFAVIPDPEGKRVGSGGATLGVIKYISEKEGTSDFSGLRILVIHSGGDSKRVPQYSALGKLFSPVPHELPNGRISTLFDEFLIVMSSVAPRVRDGMLLVSGDVLLLFNPLQIDYSGNGAAAISFKEDANTGKNHGVFLRGEDGYVQKFLHKQSVESLTAQGAVNIQNKVDIDTGAVIFSTEMLNALFSLISENGVYSEERFKQYVNETVRLSLYGDFLYPLASEATLAEFHKEKPEGDYCVELTEARNAVWNVLRPYRMKVLRLAPAKFIHFGTTREILHLMSSGIHDYEALDWSNQVGSSISGKVAGYNSVLSSKAQIGKECYLEVSYVHSKAVVGDHVLLSYVDIHDEVIPSNVVLHGLKQRDGKFVVRIYGVNDNPKAMREDCTFLGSTLVEFMTHNAIKESELWDDENHSLWNAKLYPSCSTIKEAVAAALNVYSLAQGCGDIEAWRETNRKSLSSGFNEADPYALIAWNRRMRELVQMNRIGEMIDSGAPVKQVKDIFQKHELTKIQKEWLVKELVKSDFSRSMRLHYYLGVALGEREGDRHIGECFNVIQKTILDTILGNVQYNENCKISCEKLEVKLPLRVNWGGGWSDTPPYCNEHGGTVLNAAILLNGEMPVTVTIEKIPEYKIIFESRDMDSHGEFDTIEPLQKTGDPYDPFALQKAALIASGAIPIRGGNLKEILIRMGGGFKMNSEVTNVPQGSGLGTSSILSGACMKALFEFFGMEYTADMLYSHVICMEQIMATGGGWQDQVGGLSSGIKYISTMPGIEQKIRVQHLELPQVTKEELNKRFVLIYTGQRRLARNLLRDVVGRYVGNEPDSLYSLNEIQRVAALMRFELERGHVDDFAKLLDYHWTLSKMVDAGSSNTLIDQIFESIDDLIDGRLVCGAGGGGFLQVILKRGVSKENVHMRLKEVFQDSDVDVWDVTII